ncbi:hypothetical protein [Streptomyces sp. 891-h]|uniref:hypothetical protein n=1 Tax=Streptomyces sp. 891-h TaxID=2720714 RepID=UPI001FAB22BF|nr:hypothetical protein [Streptomyces sp. 891-h]UNZ19585.1 hypothetical protein HC362_23670 [Streptomyces sp. 891-h]
MPASSNPDACVKVKPVAEHTVEHRSPVGILCGESPGIYAHCLTTPTALAALLMRK